jgi:hypothetical protein
MRLVFIAVNSKPGQASMALDLVTQYVLVRSTIPYHTKELKKNLEGLIFCKREMAGNRKGIVTSSEQLHSSINDQILYPN